MVKKIRFTFLFFMLLSKYFLLMAGIPIKETNFRSPVKHNIVLAGGFGELRGRHFHAGLDIKSRNGGEGDSIFSAEEGFISRIKIQRGGYGKVIYVDHPNGYTTVYAHLKTFSNEINSYVESVQNSTMDYEIDVRPDAYFFPLSRGQHFAFLGNTGRSSGPHLHFEIRESISDNPMNPLLFGIKPFDDIAPNFTSIRIAGLDLEFKKLNQNRQNAKKEKNGGYAPITLEIDADIVGISVAGFDQNNGSSNRNGIYKLEMFVDEQLYYGYNINSFAFKETHLIEAHTDYEVKQKENRTEILCYKLPGNKLSIIDYEYNNGLIQLDESNYKNIKIVIKDFEGNSSSQYVNIKRKVAQPLSPTPTKGQTIYQGVKQSITTQGLSVTFFEESLAKNINFNLSTSYNLKGLPEYNIGSNAHPILKNIKLVSYIPDVLKPYSDKLGLMLLGNEPDDFGQKVEGDSIITFVDDFGRYGFYVDTIAPSIVPSNFSKKTSMSTFKFRLSENVQARYQAKPLTYHVWLDGQWIACEYRESNETLTVPLKDLYNGDHHIKITAKDQFNNQRDWEGNFVFQKLN
jgi:murein DD-endopeptidase MepM/ murein hydrolase activator NlpD